MSDLTSTPTPASPSSASPSPATPVRLNTVFIWTILVLPFVVGVISVAITLPAMASTLTSTGRASQPPIVLILSLLVWVVIVVCAFLDGRYLKGLGIDKPFPWGWAILSGLVYVVGRSVVVIRRTDEGRAPMWGALIYVVLAISAAITVFSVLLNAIRG